jgi:hypothetical protein
MTDATALIELVRARYGSLEAPNYSWTHGAFDAKPHDGIVGELRTKFEVKDLTDPNDDVSTNLVVGIPGRAEWQVWLSLVGPFAAVTRGDPAGARVVSGRDGGDSHDHALVDALAGAGLEVLCRDVLETPISMPMFNAEPGEVTLFNALFTDADLRPW